MNSEELPNDREYITNMLYDQKDKEMALLKKIDSGYNKVYRKGIRASDGKIVNKKVDIYTSGFIGSRIRNAETGEYYNFLVGSRNEDIFFKVSLATGECTSKNGSNTLFYLSPNHFMSHLNADVNQPTITAWCEKRNKVFRNRK